MDDVRDCCQVLVRFINDGTDFSSSTPTTVPPDFDPTVSTAPELESAPIPVAGAFTEGPGFVVKCRGLPYSASDKEIREFFSGCEVPSE